VAAPRLAAARPCRPFNGLPESANVDLHRYRFRLRTGGTVRFPAFPGPALRGALGDQREVYHAFFRPPAALPQKRFADPPRPIVLHPRFGAGTYGPGSALELDVTLAGTAGAHFATLLRGLARVGQQGVGADRNPREGAGTFAVERVDVHGPAGVHPVVTPDGWVRLHAAPWRYPDDFAAPASPAGTRTLHVHTPTFIRRGPDARGSLALPALVEDLLLRLSLLSQAYGPGAVYARAEEVAIAAAAAAATIDDAALRWDEVPRFSRRQERPMTFGGWVGWIRYAVPPDEPWLPLLRAAHLLHAGKHTAFGFGALELAPTDEARHR
jgi:hypothetical protein